tara:strand:- start:186 stop:1562 length:1377 start_codon:yes stop_codon:yes gene_type:complete
MKSYISLISLFIALSPAFAIESTYPLTENSFNNPDFVKRFVGTYAADQTISPQISQDEGTLLQAIAPLMQTNYQLAINRIKAFKGQAAVERKDVSPALDYFIASLYLQNGLIDPAIPKYLAAIKAFPNFYRAYQNLGLAYVQKGDYSNAVTYLTKALEIGGGNGGLYGLIGYSYLNTDRPETALDAYRNALLFEPDSNDWRLGKLNALVATGDSGDAARYIDELLLDMPENSDLWMKQANSFLALQRYEDAIANLNLLRGEGKASTPALVLLGDLFLNENMANEAVEVYLEVSAKEDLSSDRKINLVRGLLSRAMNEQAETLIEELTSNSIGDLTPDQELDLLTLQARTALALGKAEVAFDVLQDVVKRDPLNGEAQLTLGDFYRTKGDLVRATFAYEAAEKVADYEVKALTAQARMKVSQRDYAEAIKLLRRAQILQERDYVADYIRTLEAALASTG